MGKTQCVKRGKILVEVLDHNPKDKRKIILEVNAPNVSSVKPEENSFGQLMLRKKQVRRKFDTKVFEDNAQRDHHEFL
ncbi:ubiquitin hydrolase [Sesbania bispinosa]|nr:ubiquitin hydrolase [Sesbania bispinosa]